MLPSASSTQVYVPEQIVKKTVARLAEDRTSFIVETLQDHPVHYTIFATLVSITSD